MNSNRNRIQNINTVNEGNIHTSCIILSPGPSFVSSNLNISQSLQSPQRMSVNMFTTVITLCPLTCTYQTNFYQDRADSDVVICYNNADSHYYNILGTSKITLL